MVTSRLLRLSLRVMVPSCVGFKVDSNAGVGRWIVSHVPSVYRCLTDFIYQYCVIATRLPVITYHCARFS